MAERSRGRRTHPCPWTVLGLLVVVIGEAQVGAFFNFAPTSVTFPEEPPSMSEPSNQASPPRRGTLPDVVKASPEEPLPNPEAQRNSPRDVSPTRAAQGSFNPLTKESNSEGCFQKFVSGRALFGPSIQRTYDQVFTQTECEEICGQSWHPLLKAEGGGRDTSFQCTFYSFGYLHDHAKGPRCYLTDNSKRSLNTSVNPKFAIHERQEYCRPDSEGRIMTGNSQQRPRTDRQTFPSDGPRRTTPLDRQSGFYYRDEEDDGFLLNEPVGVFPGQTLQAQSSFENVCFRLAVSSRRLADRYIKKSETAYSLDTCKDFCATETDFVCNGFAYRRPLSQGEILNCDLTEQDSKTLDQYNSYDFYESAVTDFYERTSGVGQDCREPSPTTPISPTVEGGETTTNTQALPVDPECYARIRTAYKHYTYRDYKTVSSVNQCALECRRTSYCATYSYRYGTTSTSDIGNCLLSDKKSFELTDQDLVSTAAMAGDWDVFDLKTGGRCDDFNSGRNDCYRRERVGYKHYFTAIRDTLTVDNVADCSDACHRLGRVCASFSFRYSRVSTDSRRDNCLLSSLAVARALSTDSVTADRDWDLYESVPGPSCSGTAENACFRLDRDNFKHIPTLVKDSISVASVDECSLECHRLLPSSSASMGCQSFSFRNFRTTDNCIISTVDVTTVEVERDLTEDGDWEFYQSLDGGSQCSSGEEVDVSDEDGCYQRLRSSYKHYTSVIKEFVVASDVRDCSRRCYRSGACNSFSFHSFGTLDNCALSTLDGADIRDSDLVSDSDWNVYQLVPFASRDQCSDGNVEPETGNCFTRDKPGYKFYPSVARGTVSVRDAQECSDECKRSSFCKSFAFRTSFATSVDNCQLTALEARDIRGRDDILSDADWGIYEQEDSRTCRNDPGLVDDDDECFRQIEAGYRHLASAYEESIRVRAKDDCSVECLKRKSCNTFSYQYFASSSTDNCLLSQVDTVSLDFRDKTRDSNWDIFEQMVDTRNCRRVDDGNTIDDCFERLKESYKHRSSAARQFRDAFSITDCETYCRRASYCVSFSFRDLTDRDNCILSDIRVTTSSDDFNLEYNRDWDVYRPIFGGRCDEHIDGGGGTITETGECFRLFNSGYRFTSQKIRETLSAFHIRDCENACLDTRFFDCRSFSYRDGATSRNCDLTAEDPLDLSVRLDLIADFDYKIYERRSSAACDASSGGGTIGGGGSTLPGRTVCSRMYKTGYRFEYQVVKEVTDARDSRDCEEKCLAAYRIRCTGFSFRSANTNYRNCELTDREVSGLRTLSDIDVARDWDIYDRIDNSGSCRGDSTYLPGGIDGGGGLGGGGGGIGIGGGIGGSLGGGGGVIAERLSCYNLIRDDHTFQSRAILTEVVARDVEDCAVQCDRLRDQGRDHCQAFSYRSYSSAVKRNCMLSDFFGRSIDSELERDFNTQVWEYRGDSDPRCQRRRSVGYSVSGKTCQYGAELNPDVRYWYCRTQNDAGWDYCCRPGNTCGYSNGYDYPCSMEKKTGYYLHANAPPGTILQAGDPLNLTNSLTIHHKKYGGEDGEEAPAKGGQTTLPSASGDQPEFQAVEPQTVQVHNIEVEIFEPVDRNIHGNDRETADAADKTNEPIKSVRQQSRLPRLLVNGDRGSGLARVRLEPLPSPAQRAPDPDRVNFRMVVPEPVPTIATTSVNRRRPRVESDLRREEETNETKEDEGVDQPSRPSSTFSSAPVPSNTRPAAPSGVAVIAFG
eukprot:maker-scaffold109_size355148-snap-gene-0.17 protein:Tk11025 transcript:maker-scaffold109_size355148-snap-gene-0.17-mRNA-1 annotation:"hypothetical protein DAPPUDRAFT_257231"